MHFNIDWDITVGKYRLALLDKVEIHSSVDLLADTCTIVLPGYVWNKPMKLEDKDGKPKIVRGDKVVVKMGYDDNLKTEFEGYLLSVATDDGSITLTCEDDLFVMRKTIPNKELKPCTLKQIAQYVVDQTKCKLELNCSYDFQYEKFVIFKASGYDVLKKLVEETKANIFIKNGVLHVHPPYAYEHGKVTYSFQHHIENCSLKYKLAEDKKIKVEVTSTNTQGKATTITEGEDGGDTITLKRSGMTEQAMKRLAQEQLQLMKYDGYEGSITGWLIPTVRIGDSAIIKDEDFEYKEGRYYVVSVTTKLSEAGGSREVQLGRRLGQKQQNG